MISILCPTRGRPLQCQRMIDSAVKTSVTPPEIYLAFTEENYGDNYTHKSEMPDYPTCHKWNKLAGKAMKDPEAKLFMLGADDMIFFTEGWDKALIDHYNALENKIHVYHLRDSRDENGTPHPIVTREYIEVMGYFLPPIFLHWYVDSWTVEMAKANNCFTHMKDFLLIHDKPSDHGESDETHKRIRDRGWHERDKYVNDSCQEILAYEKKRLQSFMLDSEVVSLREKRA